MLVIEFGWWIYINKNIHLHKQLFYHFIISYDVFSNVYGVLHTYIPEIDLGLIGAKLPAIV